MVTYLHVKSSYKTMVVQTSRLHIHPHQSRQWTSPQASPSVGFYWSVLHQVFKAALLSHREKKSVSQWSAKKQQHHASYHSVNGLSLSLPTFIITGTQSKTVRTPKINQCVTERIIRCFFFSSPPQCVWSRGRAKGSV